MSGDSRHVLLFQEGSGRIRAEKMTFFTSSLEKYVLTLLMTASAPFLGSVHGERPEMQFFCVSLRFTANVGQHLKQCKGFGLKDCLRFLEEEEEKCFPSPANDGKIIA